MKKILVNALLWAVAGILPVSMAFAQETAQHYQKTDLTGVKAVSVNGNFKIVLKQGAKEEMHISAPAEVLPRIAVKTGGTKVDVSVKGKLKQNYAPFEIEMTLSQLEDVELSGSATMEIKDGFSCKKISVEMKENTVFTGDIQTTDKISIEMSDKAEWKGALTSTKEVKVELSDYATMEVRGHTPSFSLSQNNHTRFGTRDFHVDKAGVKMSNLSTAGLTVNKELSATVADGAVLTYGGMPKTKVNASGSAKVQAF